MNANPRNLCPGSPIIPHEAVTRYFQHCQETNTVLTHICFYLSLLSAWKYISICAFSTCFNIRVIVGTCVTFKHCSLSDNAPTCCTPL